jgi:hypothetical protein
VDLSSDRLLMNEFKNCGERGDEADVVLQVAAPPMSYVVHCVTTRGMRYAQPVSHAGYSNVHSRH